MTKEQVIELARKCGVNTEEDILLVMERFAKLVRNAALSEAAQVCFRSAAYAGDPIDNARLMDCGAVIQKLKEPTP